MKKRDVLYVVYLAHKIVELVNRETSLSVSPFFLIPSSFESKKGKSRGRRRDSSEVFKRLQKKNMSSFIAYFSIRNQKSRNVENQKSRNPENQLDIFLDF